MSTLRRPLESKNLAIDLQGSYWKVEVLEFTGSTQSDLTAQIRAGKCDNGKVIATEFQSAGRGRLDRTFLAPPSAALLFSFFVTPSRASSDWGWLPLLAGQALVKALKKEVNFDAQAEPSLKWPNDVVINGKKIAGLLCERIELPGGAGVVIGMGINIDLEENEIPIPTASSLHLQGFSGCNRSSLLATILLTFADYLQRWEAGDPAILSEYLAMSATVGKRIRIEPITGAIREALAVGVDPGGGLLLADGEILSVGDIYHLGMSEE